MCRTVRIWFPLQMVSSRAQESRALVCSCVVWGLSEGRLPSARVYERMNRLSKSSMVPHTSYGERARRGQERYMQMSEQDTGRSFSLAVSRRKGSWIVIYESFVFNDTENDPSNKQTHTPKSQCLSILSNHLWNVRDTKHRQSVIPQAKNRYNTRALGKFHAYQDIIFRHQCAQA